MKKLEKTVNLINFPQLLAYTLAFPKDAEVLEEVLKETLEMLSSYSNSHISVVALEESDGYSILNMNSRLEFLKQTQGNFEEIVGNLLLIFKKPEFSFTKNSIFSNELLLKMALLCYYLIVELKVVTDYADIKRISFFTTLFSPK